MKPQDSYTIGEITLSYSKKTSVQISTTKISSSQDAERCLRELFPVTQINYREHFYVVYLNNSNKVLGYQLISIGGITATMVDLRIIFQGALLAHATSMILCHNHPSGKLEASTPDQELTEKIQAAGKVLDITVLDHIILIEDDYYSFVDNGIL